MPPRVFLLLVFTGTVLAAALSLYAVWEAALVGHERLEPQEAICLYIGDGVALFWFLRSFVVYCLLGSPLENVPVKQFKESKLTRVFWLTLGLAAVIDLFFTGFQLYKEQKSRERAVQVQGEVYLVETRRSGNSIEYDATYRFLDTRGANHRGSLSASEIGGNFVEDRLPPQVQQALRLGETPFPISVDFDPEWPGRHWPTDIARLMDNAHAMLFSVFAFGGQLFGLGVFAALLQQWTARTGLVPWWHSLYQAAPFLGEVVFLMGAALYVHLMP